MASYDEQREIDGEPRTVKEMADALSDSVKDASAFIIQCTDAYEVRNCIWAGQSDDGRKHASALGEEAFPWENASDTRIRLADEIINDHVIIKVNAFLRSSLKAKAVESNDERQAGAVTAFLNWLFTNKMEKNSRTEARLIANWEELYGHDVMFISWDQEIKYEPRTVTIEELKAAIPKMAQQNPQMAKLFEEMLVAVFDDDREEDVMAWLMSLFPDMKRKDARNAIETLRIDGTFQVYEMKVKKSQPCWTACRPFRDVFYPANTTNLETASWIAFRECLSAAELRLRIEVDGYNSEAVEKVIETCIGQTVLAGVELPAEWDSSRKLVTDNMEDRIEIFCFYERVNDERGGITIKKTVFAPDCEDALLEGDSPYQTSEYPAVPFVRFQTERLLIENSGVPEKVDTQQAEIKTQRDYRVDRSSIAILPPVEIPQTRQNLKLKFGPAEKVPVRKRGDVGFMEVPRMDPDTAVIEQQVVMGVDSYFGRWKEGVHPARQSLYSQLMVDDFLGSMTEVIRKTLALCRYYWSDELFERVTGVKMPFAVVEGRSIDDFGFDITLQFNAADLDLEQVYKKIKAVTELLPTDTMGKVDRGKFIQWAMRVIDYSLAENVVKSDEDATYAEVEDEQVQFTKIAAGVDPPIKEGGQNAGLRLQVLESIMKSDPGLQQRYAQDELFKGRLDKRTKAFQFQLQQRQNAQIGKLGVDPGPVTGGNGSY
jgi:hypothetical protein